MMRPLFCNASEGGEGLLESTDAERVRAVLTPSNIAFDAEVGHLPPPPLADVNDWRSEEVGWGLVLPELPADVEDRGHRSAGCSDAEQAFQDLVAHREGVVLRWGPNLRPGYLRRYDECGREVDLNIAGGPIGKRPDKIPRYLLLGGGPADLPWSLQYRLNLRFYTGRLPLTGKPLARYVERAANDWSDAPSFDIGHRPLMWSVNHGDNDITSHLEALIADPIWACWEAESDLFGCRRLRGTEASADALLTALDNKPPLVITCSHGRTGPAAVLASGDVELGSLQDNNYRALNSGDVLSAWQPDGAIWYAHACCSAGADAPSQFAPLFAPDGSIGRSLANASTGGARISPLPLALLSAEKPARAFVGHVEPTFDWTISDPTTGASLAQDVEHSFYFRLHQPGATIGFALNAIPSGAGNFFAAFTQLREQVEAGVPKEEALLFNHLAALDRQSLVILGDPAVTLVPERTVDRGVS